MSPSGSQSPATEQIREFLAHQPGPWSSISPGRLTIRPYKNGYLSTMFRVDGADDPYLVILKHHDTFGKRAMREFEVLSIIGGTLAPRAILLDNTQTWAPDPVLVTTYIEPIPIDTWSEVNLDRLARLMATIHTDDRLMGLAIDRVSARSYSISLEFTDETRDVPTFRPSPIKDDLTQTARILESHINDWQRMFQDDVLVYVHGDLPHHHLFQVERQWQTIHWEWSRQSHPTRELARALWDLELSPELETVLLTRYGRYAPYTIHSEALEVQRLLQYFYNAVHVAFWLDRATDPTHSAWEQAMTMCRVVRLWVEMRAEKINAAA